MFFVAIIAVAGVVAYIEFSTTSKASATRSTTTPFPVARAELVAEYRITASLVPINPGDISAAQATAAAGAKYAVLGGDLSAAQAYRVQFTDPAYGTVSNDAAETITPFDVNKNAWLVLIPNTTNAIFDPRENGKTYVATLAVFVDATSGDVIDGQTIAQ
jgi:hypothetical protein